MINPDDPRITAYALGELEDADRQAVEEALSDAPDLRREVEEIRNSIDLLSQGLQSEPCPELTQEQREKIAACADASSTEKVAASKTPIDRTRYRRFALAIAVSLLIVACGVTTVLIPSIGESLFPKRGIVARQHASQPSTSSSDPADVTTPSSDEWWSEEESESDDLAHDNLRQAVESQRLNKEARLDGTSAGPATPSFFDAADPEVKYRAPTENARPRSGVPAVAGDDYGEDRGGMGGYPGLAPGMGAPSRMGAAPGMGGAGGMGGGGMGGGGMGAAPGMGGAGGMGGSGMETPANMPQQDFDGYPGMGGSLPKPIANSEAGYDARPDAIVPPLGDEWNRYGGAVMGGGSVPADEYGYEELEEMGGGMRGEPAATPNGDASGPAPVPRVNFSQNGQIAGPGEDMPSETAEFESGDREGRFSLDPMAVDRKQVGETDLADLRRFSGSESELSEEDRRPLEQKEAEPAGEREESEQRATRTWRRASATPNASRLMIGDRDELPLEGMQANVLVDGFRARVLLDCYYFNDRNQQLEGNFKLRLPNDASLYYFAFGESAFEYRPAVDQLAAKGFLSADLARAADLAPEGILRAREGTWSKVKEARIVPKEKAAHAYSETVRRRVDPALVEWSGAGVFQTRVFPLMPQKLHRIVIGYDVTLQQDGEDLVYQLDLPEELSQCTVDLNVAALPGATATVTPNAQPFTSAGRAYYHFSELADPRVSVRLRDLGPTVLTGQDDETGEFFAARFTPDIPAGEKSAGSSQAVFLVDTSLSSRPEKFNVWLDVLEATLTKNRGSLRQFAVLFFNIESHWWKEDLEANTPENVDALMTYCRSLALEGATDLEQALAEAATPSWIEPDRKPAETDLFLLSDGAMTWGDMNQHNLSRTLQEDSVGSLFAFKTGLTGTATAVLEHLARESGGAVFSIANSDEIESAATAYRSRPWKLLNVELLGGSDILVAGRPQFIYPGQTLTLVGRGSPGKKATLRLRRAGENRDVQVRFNRHVDSQLTPRAYGQIAVGQLEDLGADLQDVSVAYARHFRVTGKTCSLLMLESEQDYQRFDIKPEEDAFVITSSPTAELIAKKLDELAEQLSDAKANFEAWLAKLERTPGFEFKVPTALRLVVERLPREAFDVNRPRLICKQRRRGGAPKKYLQQLDEQRLDYGVVTAEAERRLEASGTADALRSLSCLVETNPGDPVVTRDVAFSAMEWGLGGQAYPLLRRLVEMRPYEPQTYQALGQCLAELGNADLAMVYYEIALNGQWHDRYRDVHQIVSVEYLHLLRRIQRERLDVHASEYARGRLRALAEDLPTDKADLVVMMMWNTDRTDVDLHVIEPSGEECYYDHPRTRSGGQITRDVTEGFGPEMYIVPNAPHGSYRILANYYGTDANRTQVRTKVYITIYEDFGGKRERINKMTITLSDTKEKRELAKLDIR